MKKLNLLLCSLLSIFIISNVTINNVSAADTSSVLKISDYDDGSDFVQIPVEEYEYIDFGNGEIARIDELLSFENHEQVEEFMESFNNIDIVENYEINLLDNNYTVAVDTIQHGYATVTLYCSYSTSGNHSGKILSHDAYTTFSGYTLSLGWEERFTSSRITSSGKDIYVEAARELITYFLVDGLLEISRQDVSLSGYCYAIR